VTSTTSTPLQMRYLGRTGLKVSELCLGTMTFGRETSEAGSHAMLDAFVAAGGTFIDTANVYTRGVSEEILGRWLARQPRDEYVIATKVRFGMGPGANEIGLSRKHIRSSVEASLRRLQTDYIDLYQVHCWDRGTPLEETLRTLDDLVREGKVRYIGASNFTAWQLQKAIDLSRQNGWEPFTCLQPLYNLLDRYTEWELMPVCQNEGLGVIPWSPLRGGWLSGKYHRGMTAPVENTRIEAAEQSGWSERWSVYATERTWSIIDELLAIAGETGKSPAQVALNWVLHQPGVTAPIIGARTLRHLHDNLGAAGWTLAADHMQRLSTVSAQPAPYPHDFIARAMGNR